MMFTGEQKSFSWDKTPYAVLGSGLYSSPASHEQQKIKRQTKTHWRWSPKSNKDETQRREAKSGDKRGSRGRKICIFHSGGVGGFFLHRCKDPRLFFLPCSTPQGFGCASNKWGASHIPWCTDAMLWVMSPVCCKDTITPWTSAQSKALIIKAQQWEQTTSVTKPVSLPFTPTGSSHTFAVPRGTSGSSSLHCF